MDADGCFYCACILAMLLYALSKFSRNPELGEPKGFGKWMANKWYVDEIYDALIVKPLNGLARFLQPCDRKMQSLTDGEWNGKAGAVWQPATALLAKWPGGGYVLLMVIGMVVLFVVQLFLRK